LFIFAPVGMSLADSLPGALFFVVSLLCPNPQ
jgi:hypothetical protein